jgi:D-glycero-D-manno-heptose 1,7-bisphosphate phosphatase
MVVVIIAGWQTRQAVHRSGTLRTIFLDRDGVLNEKMPEGSYVTAWAEFRMLPGVPEAIARLNRAGLRVIVVSNQRGIALGLYSEADVATIQAKLQQYAKGDTKRMWMASTSARMTKGNATAVSHCRACLSRHDAIFRTSPASTSAIVGDSLSDVEFGKRLGMRTVLIEGGAEQRKACAEEAAELADDRFGSLPDAVEAR